MSTPEYEGTLAKIIFKKLGVAYEMTLRVRYSKR